MNTRHERVKQHMVEDERERECTYPAKKALKTSEEKFIRTLSESTHDGRFRRL